jgi:tight adherence protein C
VPIPEVGIPLLVFGVVAAGTYALLALFDPYWMRVRSRVSQLDTSSGPDGRTHSGHEPKVAGTRSRIIDELQRLNPYQAADRSRIRQRLAKAGMYNPAAISRFVAAKLLLTVVSGGVAVGAGATGLLPMRMAIVAACVLAGFGFLVPSLWLDRAIARHHLALQRSLPDFLDLMTVCLEGGLSLQETIRRVSDELRVAHPTLASELGFVQRDIEVGATVDQALKRFAIRCDYEGVRTLSTFIREAQRFGTNITDALRSHADMLRSQREQAAEESAQKAAVKILIPTLLLIFPATFVVIVGPAVIQIHDAFAAK